MAMPPAVYLASASPRRRELLAQLGVRFEVVAAGVDETRLPGEAALDHVLRLALAKARDGLRRVPDAAAPVLGADTIVVCDGEFFGKPANEAAATAMLRRLAGATHEVWSGVALASPAREVTACSRSEVTFRPISAAEIADYWASGEPRDKAGAYAIQGLGAIFARELRGSYSGVMGLPLFETAQLLAGFGISVLPPARSVA
jgi:septum formation protein